MRLPTSLLLWLLWPSLLLLAQCTSPKQTIQDGLTGIDLSVHFEESLQPDQLHVRLFSGDDTALSPFQLPETPRTLKSSPQSFVLLVPDSMADTTLRIEIAGYSLAEIVASGSTEVTLRHQVLINGTVTLDHQDPCPDDADGDGTCDTEDTCVDADTDGLGTGVNGNTGCLHPDTDQDDTDPYICGDTDDDTCEDCLEGTFSPEQDGQDTDDDGACDEGDPDDDGDNQPDTEDSAPSFPNVCSDTDNDGWDDCSSGTYNVQNDGDDYDGDGLCDRGDPDNDNDGVPDNGDSAPLDSTACSDNDNDDCDDCNSGTYDVQNDGADYDSDGRCNEGDLDDDNDGAPDSEDNAPFNPLVCSDTDGDTCEDCVNGSYNVLSDGLDFDSDGLCNAGDPDDDNDTVLDGNDDCPAGNLQWKSTSETDYDSDGCKDSSEDTDDDNDGALDAADSHDNNPTRCSDTDNDTCDDCASGSFNPGLDGIDTDSDGQCDFGDNDDDNDGALDFVDSHDTDRFRCSDTDNDTCDDCASGSFQPSLDGVDTDSDGACNQGDLDDDGDGRNDLVDNAPLNPALCADTDNDTCDDCTSGTFNPANDGTDTDNNGACNEGDPDDDGDGVNDNTDSAPLNNALCSDTDNDTCDDCTSLTFSPQNDGTDTDKDGKCNQGDPDDDGDLIPDHVDTDSLNPRVCADTDGDTCDDCALTTWAPENDGTDTDSDGICDQGDYCVHVLVNGTWEQTTDCRVLIPGGYFTFGDENFEEDLELPDFYMDVFPVSAEQFGQCVSAGACTYNVNPSDYGNFKRLGYGTHPMNNISHPEAAAYCAWKNGRLPTEQEWEKAARGTDGPTYPWGETIYPTRANYQGSNDPFEQGTTPVGYYNGINTLSNGIYTLDSTSDFGLYDMSGNVWEWTSTPDGNYFIVRGGSFLDVKSSYSLKTYGYSLGTALNHYINVGFRCVE